MRKLAVVLAITTFGFTGATLLAPSAGAAVPAVSGLCNALTNLHYQPSSNPTAAGGEANAKKLSKAFSNAAKKANGSIKQALKTMAQYFKDVANVNANAIQNDAQAFAAATTRYVNYITTNCVPGLPSNITIPTLPNQ